MSNSPGINGAGPGGGLSGREALELSELLAGLARAGLPLGPSLAAMAEELPRGRLRRASNRSRIFQTPTPRVEKSHYSS